METNPDSIAKSFIRGRGASAVLAIVAGLFGVEMAHDPNVPIGDQLEIVIPIIVATASAALALLSKKRETDRGGNSHV